MDPLPLDDSLLTAYLDDELSDSERALVEERLEVDDRWKQLLNELENVRKLIQELPKSVLSRSIAVGPWNEVPFLASTAVKRESDLPHRTRSKTLFASLAMAASMAICAVGAFAWMRFGNTRDELAESLALSPSPSPPAPLPEDGARGVRMGKNASSRLPDPVATYYAIRTNAIEMKTRLLKSTGELLAAQVDEKKLSIEKDKADNQDSLPFFLKPIPNSVESATVYIWGTRGAKMQAATAIEFLPDRRYEIRLQRSDLSSVTRVLRESGLEVAIENATSEETLEDKKSKADLKKRRIEVDDTSIRRPPALTGAIAEPTDWICIVIEGR